MIRAAPATPAASVSALSASGHVSREAAVSWSAQQEWKCEPHLMTRLEEVSEPGNVFGGCSDNRRRDRQKTVLTSRRNLDVPLIFVKVMETWRRRKSTHHFAAPVSADPRLTLWDRVVLIAIWRLYDSYADANRVVIGSKPRA